jgi:hypothetical protein
MRALARRLEVSEGTRVPALMEREHTDLKPRIADGHANGFDWHSTKAWV